LIHANEALWGGSRKEIGALKAFITDPTIIIEGKGKDALPIDNCRHLIVSSNEDWAVPIDLDDRRFFVLNVSSHRKEDISYFHSLSEQMDQKGLSSLLFDLLHEDLTSFDPRKMLPNDFGFDIKMKTANSSEKFIFNALQEGRCNLERKWSSLSCEEFYDGYKAWCQREGFRQEASSEFGKRLRKLLSVEKSRRSVDGSREWWYMLPSLEECRKRFQSFTKQTSGIWEE
jgi:phage/plasmid-associated DNA primase